MPPGVILSAIRQVWLSPVGRIQPSMVKSPGSLNPASLLICRKPPVKLAQATASIVLAAISPVAVAGTWATVSATTLSFSCPGNHSRSGLVVAASAGFPLAKAVISAADSALS